MKYLIIILIFCSSVNCLAGESKDLAVSNPNIELSNAMGLEKMIDSLMIQTKKSAEKQMNIFIANVVKKYPSITKQQEDKLKNIANNYCQYMLNSIDTKKISTIYIDVIANNMTEEERYHAINFYKSPKGKKIQKTAAKAAFEIQKYWTTQIEKSNETAHEILMSELQTFFREIESDSK